MIVGETTNIFAFCITHSGILAFRVVPFQADTIVGVQLRRDVPVVSGKESQFVFITLVVFRGILVEIIVGCRAVVFLFSQGARMIKHGRHFLHGVVIHRGAGGIVIVVMPLVEAHTPSHVAVLALEF